MHPWNYVTTQRFMTEDLPMFSALWWPRAELSELYILTCVVGWLFLWHDTVSEPQGARAYDSLAQPKNNRRHTGNSRSSAKVSRYEITDIRYYAKYGRNTKDFLRHCLQVISYEKAPKSSSVKEGIKVLWSNIATGRGLNNHYAVPKNLNSIIHRFESIGNQIRAVYTIEQRVTLLDEISKYIDSTIEMQMHQATRTIVSVKSYWKMRMGSSGYGAITGLLDLSNKLRLSFTIMEDDEISLLVEEANKIISMTNDLLSFQNFTQGSTSYIMNHVALAFAEQEHKDLQLVIDQAVEFIKAAVERFDSTAAWLLSGPRDDLSSRAHLRAFVYGCRESCTGNLEWGLFMGRYGQQNVQQADDSLKFVFYADADIIREGPVGDQGDGAYSTGRGGAANIESPWAAGVHNGSAHDVEVIPEQALRRESQVDTHTGRGGAANVRHASSSAPAAAASGPPGQDIMPIEQQNHHSGRGGEGNVQHSSGKHEGAVDTLKHMVFGKKN
ncbi:hypothetical protein MMC32_000650 [Xylographa parallela]|nr:hypothetical protein [Xylographa parallela]